MRYRKKPVVIEAFQMTKDHRWDNSEWPEWLHEAWNGEPFVEGSVWIDREDEDEIMLMCGTLSGMVSILWNYWIIRGVEGEIYPCEPSIFEQTYEPSND